jgi:hypothetical protein
VSLTTENQIDTPTLNAIATAGPPTAVKPLVHGTKADPKPKQIGRKLKLALDLMVFGDIDGNPYEWNDAARKVGLSLVAMRKALERAHVLRYLREQKQVFRQSVSASNILHARRIRNASGNAMASLGAIKLLEQMDERAPAAGTNARNVIPGVVVIVNANREAPLIDHQRIIEVNPLQSQDDVGHDE